MFVNPNDIMIVILEYFVVWCSIGKVDSCIRVYIFEAVYHYNPNIFGTLNLHSCSNYNESPYVLGRIIRIKILNCGIQELRRSFGNPVCTFLCTFVTDFVVLRTFSYSTITKIQSVAMCVCLYTSWNQLDIAHQFGVLALVLCLL